MAPTCLAAWVLAAATLLQTQQSLVELAPG